MPRPAFLTAVRRALPVSLAVALVIPAVATAADAPLRAIAFDETGAPFSNAFSPFAVSPGGLEVLEQPASGAPLIRNVTAGTSTRILDAKATAVNASTDLRRILFLSWTARSAADTNGGADYYVLDRDTNAITLVSRTSTDGPASGLASPVDTNLDAGVISGDGSTVLFSRRNHYTDTDPNDVDRRYDMATGTVTTITNASGLLGRSTDTTGKVAVTRNGVFVGTTHFDLPVPDPSFSLASKVAPDGRTVAFLEDALFKSGRLFLMDTTTGATRVRTVPQWLTDQSYDLIGVGDGGSSVIVGMYVTRPAGKRYVIGRISAGTGGVTQLGGDISVTNVSTAPRAYTTDYGFAATPSFLVQLGTAPIPGVDAGLPPVKATDYLSLQDSQCVNTGLFTRAYSRPSAWLLGPQGADPRQPAKADVVVRMTATGKIANQFTLALDQKRELTVGKNGGWNITLKVSFADGSQTTGVKDIPVHSNPPCEPYWF